MCMAAKSCGGIPMSDAIWGGLVALAICIYLVYALLKPEKF